MIDFWLRVFRHVLPQGRAWRMTVDKFLRQWFEGLSQAPLEAEAFIDDVYDDQRPQTTRELDEYEAQFGLTAGTLTEQERRDRLAGEWKALGGQDPRYIQDTLQNAGFNVFVHEWWEPGSEPAVGTVGPATARNPLDVLQGATNGAIVKVNAGDTNVTCGDTNATCGDFTALVGYPLVNKIPLPGGGGGMVNFVIPTDATTYPFFLYIGDAVFPNTASIPAARRDEFETLCLKLCPTQQWIGVLVEFV